VGKKEHRAKRETRQRVQGLITQWYSALSHLRPFTTEAPGKGEILGLNGYTLSMDSGQVGVLEKGDEVSLSSFLESHHSGRLETEIGLEILSNFTDKPLEWKLADEELSRLLVPSDFTKGDSSGAEPMGLLNTTSGSLGCLAGGLGCELLTRSFASGRFAGGLLGASHELLVSMKKRVVLRKVVAEGDGRE